MAEKCRTRVLPTDRAAARTSALQEGPCPAVAHTTPKLRAPLGLTGLPNPCRQEWSDIPRPRPRATRSKSAAGIGARMTRETPRRESCLRTEPAFGILLFFP